MTKRSSASERADESPNSIGAKTSIHLPPPPSRGALVLPKKSKDGETFRKLTLKTSSVRNQPQSEKSKSYVYGVWRTGPLLGQDYQVVVVKPDSKHLAANNNPEKPKEVLIYIPGVNFSEKGFLEDAKLWANMYGREMVVVVNDMDRSSVQDYFNAAVGAFSSHGVSGVEPDALKILNREIAHHSKLSRQIRLVPYSQGGSIANAAILGKLRETDPALWRKLLSRIRIESFGSDLDNWAWTDKLKREGMNVREYMHSGDVVPDLTHGASTTKVAIKKGFTFARYATGDLWGEAQAWWNKEDYQADKSKRTPFDSYQGEEVILKFDSNDAHNAEGYSANMPSFLIQAHTNSKQEINGRALARELAQTISNGVYSDRVHDSVIRSMVLRRRDSAFARELLKVVEDGSIGNYEVPELGRLIRLAR